ncbi:cytidine deaminase-like protein [Syncephalis plumigaleata]|nr:cytidine deaminase-like protein [Syncephalis plumigaleata]
MESTSDSSISTATPDNKTLELVLSEAETRELETVEVYVSSIDPKSVSTVLKFAERKLPTFTRLNHLKRIRRTYPNPEDKQHFTLTILLCPIQETDDTEALSMTELQSRIDAADLTTIIKPSSALVSRHAPLTRAQYEAWRVNWPINFREHVQRTQLPMGDELNRHETWMRKTIKEATRQSNAISQDCSNTTNTRTVNKDHQQPTIISTAMMVNPTNNQLIAMAHDTRDIDKHPLHHAVMNCIEMVAAKERASTSRKMNELGNTSHKRSIDQILDTTNEESYNNSNAYLCSNYDLYTIYEPCIMCSMALLHSRIGRVFYAIPHHSNGNSMSSCATGGGGGALGSQYRIHTHPKLNHKFKVYRHLLYDEAITYHRHQHH